MAKFYGALGFISEETTSPGVVESVPVEVMYTGHIGRNIRRPVSNDEVNISILVNNQISVIANEYSIDNLHSLVYVKWNGRAWKVSSAEVIHPRILIIIGEVYNGPQV